MIRGIGIDLVNVQRIERAMDRWGKRFLERIFSAGEIELCQGRARPAQCLALRFAAKEAYAKALGVGLRQGLRLRDIEVVHDQLGKPCLLLHDQAQKLLMAAAAKRTFLSLSDERESALAVVVLEG